MSGNDVFGKDYRMIFGMVDVIIGDIVYPEKGRHLQVFFAHNLISTIFFYLIVQFFIKCFPKYPKRRAVVWLEINFFKCFMILSALFIISFFILVIISFPQIFTFRLP